MDAFPALGLSLLVVAPGLAVYCAIYGVFGTTTRFSTVPRDPKSIEALCVVLLGALAAHALVWVIVALANLSWTKLANGAPIYNSEDELLLVAARPIPNLSHIPALLLATLVTCLVCYALCRAIMRTLAERRKLPYWLYRWTNRLADNSSALIIARVLTNIEFNGSTVLYIGAVEDLALDEKFDVARLVLVGCQRFAVDMSLGTRTRALARPVADIGQLVISGATIRNVSFEAI